MIKLTRDQLLALGLLALLVVVTFVAGFLTPDMRQVPPYASFSNAPEGTRALMLWLQALGYTTSSESSDVFAVPEDAAVMLMLEPGEPVSDGQWRMIDQWVDDGGTLVMAGEGFYLANAVKHYGFSMRFMGENVETLTLQSPLLEYPTADSATTVRASTYLEADGDGYVVHLASGQQPVLVSFRRGAGRVVISSAPFPFSNLGLKQTGNPSLVLNLITSGKRPGAIWFDEWHHGIRGAQEISGLTQWLVYSATGRALLFIAIVAFGALVLQGRRFGRPLPAPFDISRRAPLEYITAIANLHRRAGHRSAVMKQYHHRLKRELGHRYRLSVDLDDEEFVTRLAGFQPTIDAEALRTLLARLRRRSPSEADLVHASAQVADWLERGVGIRD